MLTLFLSIMGNSLWDYIKSGFIYILLNIIKPRIIKNRGIRRTVKLSQKWKKNKKKIIAIYLVLTTIPTNETTSNFNTDWMHRLLDLLKKLLYHRNYYLSLRLIFKDLLMKLFYWKNKFRIFPLRLKPLNIPWQSRCILLINLW